VELGKMDSLRFDSVIYFYKIVYLFRLVVEMAWWKHGYPKYYVEIFTK